MTASTGPDPVAERKAAAEAAKAVADARTAGTDAVARSVATYVPDLSSVDRGSGTASGEAILGPVVAHRALAKAATSVAEQIGTVLGDERCAILLVTDADYATSDAAYVEVTTAMARLELATSRTLEAIAEDGTLVPAPQGDQRAAIQLATVGAAAATAAAVIPPLLSLLSAQRSVTGTAIAVGRSAAVATVAAALGAQGHAVTIDRFRPVPDSGNLLDSENALVESREALHLRRSRAAERREAAEARRAAEQVKVDVFSKRLGDANEGDRAGIETRLDEGLEARSDAERAARAATLVEQQLDAVIAPLDEFLAAVRSGVAGGSSPLVSALLREAMHHPSGEDPAIDKVLYLGASTGSAAQVYNDRPLWSDDNFAVFGSATVSYWMIAASGNLVTSGVADGTAQVSGKVGKQITVSDVTTV